MARTKYAPHPGVVEHEDGSFTTYSKTCTKCKHTKVLDEFVADSTPKDGRRSYCKACHAEQNQRYYEANTDKVREKDRRYREANPDKLRERQQRYYEANADTLREYQQRYREVNPDKIREQWQRYYEANIDTIREKQQHYREANADKIREKQQHYREANASRTDEQIAAARTRLRPDGTKKCRAGHVAPLTEFTDDRGRADGLRDLCRTHDSQRLLKSVIDRWEFFDMWACNYCGAPFEEVEHVIPRKQGGTDDPNNLVPSCANCNRGPGGKHDQTPEQWRPELVAAVWDSLALYWRLRGENDGT